MIERFRKARQQFVFALILAVAAAFAVYFFFRENVFLIYAAAVTAFCLVLGLTGLRSFGILQKNAVTISEQLGPETKNALMFARVGLLSYDEDHFITWQSDLFDEIGLDLVGESLAAWQPDLEKNFESEEVFSITVGDDQYDVYNNQDSRTIYLHDITSFNELLSDYNDERLVFGYLAVDNFDETIDALDEQQGANLQSAVRTSLLEWAREFQIVLRRFRQENYLLICDEKNYERLVQSKFAILNKIREIGQQNHVVLGLSMGLARHEKEIPAAEDAAGEAFNLALSRGGDQVVVKTADAGIQYFGGGSESQTKLSRVKVRVIAQSLDTLYKNASTVFIMGHKVSDLDSLGASIAVAKMIMTAYDVPCHIVINPDSMEAKTKRAYRQLIKTAPYDQIMVSPGRAADFNKAHSLLISVDNHRREMAISPGLADLVSQIVVIDHHRRGEDFFASPVLTYLEPGASSTVELVVELYDYQPKPVKLTPLEATVMYAGLLVDTSNFKNRVGVRTFKTAASLKELGADMTMANELLQDDYNFVLKKAAIIQNARRYGSGILIASGPENQEFTRAMIAMVANELLDTDDTQAAFVLAKTGEQEVSISARSTNKFNVQVIMEKLGGGGHFSMAAVQKTGIRLEELKAQLLSVLDEYKNNKEESR